MIQDCTRCKKKAGDCKRRKGGNRNGTRNISNTNTNITQADIAEFHTSQPDDDRITDQVQIPRMGRKRLFNAVATNNDVSVTGSGSSKHFYIQYDDDGRISGMGISKITTRNCHVSSNNSTNHDGRIGYKNTIEIDSHADTHFFGKNFRIVSSTEQLCSVTALLDELATTNNI